ncbi:phage baseplate protein, partial [Leptospira weilii]
MGIITGRDTIALTDGDTEIEINVSLEMQHSYPAEVTGHPIEKEKGKTSVTDHVIPGQRGISLSAILSNSITIFSFRNVTVDEKLETLIRWQTNGTLVTLLGYTTDGIFTKILSLLPSFFRYVPPDDPDKRYLGRTMDEIPNLLIGDISFSESKDMGDDVSMTLSIFPIQIVEAKTRNLNAV